jgi:gamma-glutamyl phosphate reductase
MGRLLSKRDKDLKKADKKCARAIFKEFLRLNPGREEEILKDLKELIHNRR